MSALSVETDPLSVLLVDDTADLRELMKLALERGGDFRVVAQAGDGQEGVLVAREVHPQIVLLDIAMPVMDGLTALPEIRAACPEATIIMLSAFDTAFTKERAFANGANGYIQKGTPMRTLLEKIREIASASD
jgi:DNA-binding NarL/FixJ family response regulator